MKCKTIRSEFHHSSSAELFFTILAHACAIFIDSSFMISIKTYRASGLVMKRSSSWHDSADTQTTKLYSSIIRSVLCINTVVGYESSPKRMQRWSGRALSDYLPCKKYAVLCVACALRCDAFWCGCSQLVRIAICEAHFNA